MKLHKNGKALSTTIYFPANVCQATSLAPRVSKSDFYYNPNRNLSFVFSYSYNNLDAIYLAASEIDEDFNPRFAQVFGQAAHNALFIGRYKFTEGPLKRLTIGRQPTLPLILDHGALVY
jgi:hypothetical protein